MEPGLSHRNRRVAEAARLQRAEERRSRRLTLLEGPHLVDEAVKAGASLIEIFGLAEDSASARWAQSAEVEFVVVGEEALRRLSSTQTPQSPVAVMQLAEPALVPAGGPWWGGKSPHPAIRHMIEPGQLRSRHRRLAVSVEPW